MALTPFIPLSLRERGKLLIVFRGTPPETPGRPLAAGVRLAAEAEVMGATLLGNPDSSSRQEARRTQCPGRVLAARAGFPGKNRQEKDSCLQTSAATASGPAPSPRAMELLR